LGERKIKKVIEVLQQKVTGLEKEEIETFQ